LLVKWLRLVLVNGERFVDKIWLCNFASVWDASIYVRNLVALVPEQLDDRRAGNAFVKESYQRQKHLRGNLRVENAVLFEGKELLPNFEHNRQELFDVFNLLDPVTVVHFVSHAHLVW